MTSDDLLYHFPDRAYLCLRHMQKRWTLGAYVPVENFELLLKSRMSLLCYYQDRPAGYLSNNAHLPAQRSVSLHPVFLLQIIALDSFVTVDVLAVKFIRRRGFSLLRHLFLLAIELEVAAESLIHLSLLLDHCRVAYVRKNL